MKFDQVQLGPNEINKKLISFIPNSFIIFVRTLIFSDMNIHEKIFWTVVVLYILKYFTETFGPAELTRNTGYIYVVRHAEREDYANLDWVHSAGKFKHDPPLSKIGILQSIEVANKFQQFRINRKNTCILSSPFKRGIMMATILSKKLQIKMFVDFTVSEYISASARDIVPELEGTEWISEINQNASYIPDWTELKLENLSGLYKRSLISIERVLKNGICRNLIVVTHRSTALAIFGAMYKKEWKEFVEYASITTVKWELVSEQMDYKIFDFNDVTFLKNFVKAPIYNPNLKNKAYDDIKYENINLDENKPEYPNDKLVLKQ